MNNSDPVCPDNNLQINFFLIKVDLALCIITINKFPWQWVRITGCVFELTTSHFSDTSVSFPYALVGGE